MSADEFVKAGTEESMRDKEDDIDEDDYYEHQPVNENNFNNYYEPSNENDNYYEPSNENDGYDQPNTRSVINEYENRDM
eukprot:Pgem_evm1s1079